MKIISLFIAIIILACCKKELDCYDCKENKPPVANAGSDQNISLPKDSIALDGSASTDLDGNISAYKWIKISGPLLANLVSPTSSKTLVKSLIAGVYQFELTVTDNGGLSSKDTVKVSVDAPINQPPAACAGADQTITLPVNSATLDGGCSADPDNNISTYTWTKIAGPSANITNTTLAKTQVTGLVQGDYQFELKVIDAGGLFSKDTVHILVSASSCNTDPVTIISGPATLTPFGLLSQSKYVQAATAGNKLVFAGGVISPTSNASTTNSVDIYDLSSNTWSTATLGEARNGLRVASVGNKLLFASGQWTGDNSPRTIDIYDVAANIWSVPLISSQPPMLGAAMAITASTNKVFIADGNRHGFAGPGYSPKVDVYDAISNSWSEATLSIGRIEVSATTGGNKVFFAGGYRNLSWDEIPLDLSKRIDVYNMSTNTWATAELSEARYSIAAASIGNKVIFAGGFSSPSASTLVASNRVDLYDLSSDTWTTTSLSEARGAIKTAVIGTKILFAGGRGNGLSKRVDIYDASTNSWYTSQLSQPRVISSIATVGNKVLFFTAEETGQAISNWADISDASTSTWSSIQFNKSLASRVVTAGNKVFVGGGIVNTVGSYSYNFSCQVWTLDF